jgi:MFS family permease
MKNPRLKAAVVVLCLVQFVDVLGVTELLTAAPQMLRSFPAATAAPSAVLTVYAMCFGGLLMAGARLGDRFGHRRALLGGVALFAAGSLCAATAGSVAAVVVGRSLQGAAAAISVPASLRLLIAVTPAPADRRAAMAAWSGAGAAAGASGFVVGGALTQLAGWRAMFWLNLPLALFIGAGILRSVTSRPSGGGQGLNLLGGLLFSLGVAGLILGAALLQPPAEAVRGAAAAGGGVILLGAAVWAERRARHPLLPRHTLRIGRLRTGMVAASLNTATTSSLTAIATLDLQRVQHLSPGAAALRFVPLSFGGMAGAALAGAALYRLSAPRTIALGLSVIGLADAGVIGLHRAGWLLSLPVACAGLGLGVSSVAANALGTDVNESLQAAAAGALNTAAQLGTALGVAALLLLSGATAHAALPLHGPTLGWATAAAMALTGAAAIAPRTIGDRRARSAAAQPGAPTPRA